MTRTNRPGPFACVPEATFALSSNQLHVVCILSKFDETWASYATLAEWCGKSRCSVMRIMAELIELGLVDREPGGGRNGTNRYRLSAKAWEAPASRKTDTTSSRKNATPASRKNETPLVAKMRPNPDQGIKTNKTIPPNPPQGERAGGGGEIIKPKSRREGNHSLDPELQRYVDEAFDALKARGMQRGRASFDAVIAVTAGYSTADVRQALINLASGTRMTIAPDTWAEELQATKRRGGALPYSGRPNGALQPFKFNFSPAEKDELQHQTARDEAVPVADQVLALQFTSTPSPALHSQTPLEGPTTALQVDLAVHTPATPFDPAVQATAAKYLSRDKQAPAQDLLSVFS